MSVAQSGNLPLHALFMHSMRRVSYRLGELVHLCAIYLGIAVLVTMVLSATIPSLREKALEMHEALELVLKPEGFNGELFGAYGGYGLGGNEKSADATQTSQQIKEDSGSFLSAVRASEQGKRVPGITNTQAEALRSYIARKYRIAASVAGALINTVFVVSREKELDPQLVLAVIAIESRYNPYAESHVGAQGLMQVMTRVHKEKFDVFYDGTVAAISPVANIRVGTQILKDCIQRRGSIEGGLACYVGATGPSDGGYGAKVMAEWRRIALASGIRVTR
ncbi:lytic transglycosylase domain-containing protein [Allopusillimonas ginsengisoli]|uniref:lytic transglycosylase domain-containing protein n=1 Tax=Allopusillimonas ginsengisoli TaxID=453575 RepID=UPI0026CBBCC6